MTPKSTPSVSEMLADIVKTHGLKIGSPSEVVEQVEWLTSGNLSIDYVAGNGLPLGRSVELYGQPSSGKTTTGLQTAAALQKAIIANGSDEYILYFDYEHAIDPEYTAQLGLDIEHPSFLLAQPFNLEQGAEAALKLIDSGKVRLVIWDSVAAMAPLSRLEGEFDQRTAAMNRARLMSGLLLQLTPLLHKNKCTAIFINHVMESVEMRGRPGLPPKATTPGGKGLKFYASVRLEFTPIGNVKSKASDALTGDIINQAIATQVRVKCVKNKVASPFREAEVRISFGQGFDNVWSALQVLLARKVIRKTGAWYKFDESLSHPLLDKGIQGESGVLQFARQNPEWRDRLIQRAEELLFSGEEISLGGSQCSGNSDTLLLGSLSSGSIEDLLSEEML